MIAHRQPFVRPFLLSVVVVSAFTSKLLHLFQHAGSIPAALLALYFPTFFIHEVLLSGVTWFLLQKSTGLRSTVGLILVPATVLLTFCLCSSQLGFYFVTGSEVRWDAVTSVGNDAEGRKLVLSGLKSFLGSACMLLIMSWVFTRVCSIVFDLWLSALLGIHSTEGAHEESTLDNLKTVTKKRKRPARLWTAIGVSGTLLLWLIRPKVPYSHISGAIPFTFLEALVARTPEARQPSNNSFPLPELISEGNWKAPDGHFKGWSPNFDKGTTSLPDWTSGSLPPGFERWKQDTGAEKNATARKNYYDPANDPLRITNLDRKVLEPLSKALKDHDVPINHVVLVMMESTRKDVFPFESGSRLHREILNSYKFQDPDAIHQLNANLSHLTPIAEMLTGKSGGFPRSPRETDSSLWQDTAEAGMGGLNINGVLTGSSLSFKSEIVNHCGVWPLPSDFMEEIQSEIYQPCIMQVLELFNKFKMNSAAGSPKNLHERKWTSIFIQAVTGIYADQNILNDQIGFKKTVYREDIGQKDAKHYHADMEEINYFGYSEREVYPYIEDAIDDAIKNNERLFLSHFTSTTHHPWGLPKGFQSEQYFSDESLIGKHEDMNSYLNSVRYVDTWLGDLLGLLDKKGIANETLVVFVGDHGQAFQEDSPVTGCYENGHISNFRVPLVFRHPLLPKIQITANTTSLSIIPTILDLLVQTKSLNEKDSGIALDLMNEYEGQSLIRPYKATDDGRQAWNFGIISAGGEMLSIGSAAVPYRLILPLTQDFEFVFSNLATDPDEENLLRGWSVDDLVSRVKSAHGDKAGQWVVEAEKVGKWWVGESKRLYNHAE